MAIREKKRDVMITELVSKLYSAIRCMPEGSKDTIGRLVSMIYAAQGYEYRWLDPRNGHGWTRDGGKTCALSEEDLFDVMDKLDAALDGEIVLDYSEYDHMIVGLPFNLSFTVKKVSPVESN